MDTKVQEVDQSNRYSGPHEYLNHPHRRLKNPRNPNDRRTWVPTVKPAHGCSNCHLSFRTVVQFNRHLENQQDTSKGWTKTSTGCAASHLQSNKG